MHILVIPSWYPTSEKPYNGNFIQRHVELLARNHEVTVLYFSTEKIPETQIETSQNVRLKLIQVHYPKKSGKIGQFFSLKRAFKQGIREIQQVDLVHVHVMLDRGILGVWAKNHFHKPLIVTEHGSYFFRENYKNLNFRQKMTIIQTLKHVTAVSCVSTVLENEVRYLFPRVRTYLTPNVVNRDLFAIKEKKESDTLNFIHISTLETVKNVPEIIRACELLAEIQADFRLQIIREQPNEAVEQHIAVSPARDKITLTGPVKIGDVAEAIQQSDALVMLSSYETFSCVIAEAWSCGKPVISTPVGIAKDMSPAAGILVREASAAALFEALKQFRETKNSYDPDKIRSFSKEYDADAVLHSFEKMFASVLTL
ncbi:MAG: glycosyltransferase [Bacteroidota bacterium]